MLSPLRRSFLIGCAVFVFLVLAGATYQGVATAVERRRFPHPGRLVDVGGHQLHLLCQGTGAPAVVLEAPATTMSSVWAWVQTDIAKITRVCSYNRAGLGWSEMGDTGFTPDAVPTQLNALLRDADERGPFVMVGADLGAAFALLYSSRYPDETASVVLVNSSAPGDSATRSSADMRAAAAAPWLARTGVLRAMHRFSNEAAELPPPAAGALTAFLNRPDHLTRAAAEISRWDETVEMASSASQRRTLPVTQVIVEASDRLALLANRRNADDVTAAITRAVNGVRRRQAGEN